MILKDKRHFCTDRMKRLCPLLGVEFCITFLSLSVVIPRYLTNLQYSFTECTLLLSLYFTEEDTTI
jgi:hypothetical protein